MEVIHTLELAGSGYVRGRAHGAALRTEIASFLSSWFGSLRAAGILEPADYLSGMLRATRFVPAIREHAMDLFEEIEGIAVGAHQPFELMLASQLLDEEWAYRASSASRDSALQKCTSLAIRSSEEVTWIAQNMDLGTYTDRHQVLLRLAPAVSRDSALIFTVGSMLALMGVNAHGLGICVNSLPQLPSARQGLPVAFVVRKLLQAESVEQAAGLVQELPHATGQNYVVADARDIRSFEASAAGVTEYRPEDPSRVLHTNHPLAQGTSHLARMSDPTNSVVRLKTLARRLASGRPGLAEIQAALCSSDDPKHPVCRVAGRDEHGSGITGFTTGSMISSRQSSSSNTACWISAGPPSLRGYTHLTL